MATLTVSCLEDKDPYRAGFFFRNQLVTYVYANNTTDTISVYSYGHWSLTYNSNWCKPERTSGNGESLYTFPVSFEMNNSGNSRGVQFYFSDTDHPGEANASIIFWQYATRGDGSMGSAADVKAITGSDGSQFDFNYDTQHRPTSLHIAKDGTVLHDIKIEYDDTDSVLTVTDKSKTLRSAYGRDYQPLMLLGEGDTIGYASQYYPNGMPVSTTNAFNLEHRSANRQNTYYAFLLNGQSLMPDSLHNADSLRIAYTEPHAASVVDKYKLIFSESDNRYQSVDVNQLVFGTEQCDPYQLLALFRYTRSTSIVSELSTEEQADRISITPTLNTDRSVKTLTVARKGETITYNFEY